MFIEKLCYKRLTFFYKKKQLFSTALTKRRMVFTWLKNLCCCGRRGVYYMDGKEEVSNSDVLGLKYTRKNSEESNLNNTDTENVDSCALDIKKPLRKAIGECCKNFLCCCCPEDNDEDEEYERRRDAHNAAQEEGRVRRLEEKQAQLMASIGPLPACSLQSASSRSIESKLQSLERMRALPRRQATRDIQARWVKEFGIIARGYVPTRVLSATELGDNMRFSIRGVHNTVTG